MSDEKVISSTTQNFLDVYDIVNDLVILKDGTVSMILQVGTMNFSLLAEQEQDAIIFTYGSLLNSLNYPIQICIQSQTKDVTKYLRLLDEQIKKTSSDRKANLIKKYRDFVAALIKERNVLQKKFFVTVPAGPVEMGLLTASSVLPGKTTFDVESVEKSIILEKAINLLGPRRDHLTSQFNRLGLYTRQLTTQEIIQNFYINYNPEAAEGQEISSSENYTTPLVRASFGRKNMQTSIPNNTNQAAPQGANVAQDNQAQTPIIGQQPINQTQTEAASAAAQEQAAQTNEVQTASTVSPEEILSGNEQNNDEQAQTIADSQPATADQAEVAEQLATPKTVPVLDNSIDSISNPQSLNQEVVQTTELPKPEQPAPQATQAPRADLSGISLDTSPINQTEQAQPQKLNSMSGDITAQMPEQPVAQEPAQAETPSAAQEQVQTQPAVEPVATQATEPAPTQAQPTENAFAEEIKPIQQQFESNQNQVAAPASEPNTQDAISQAATQVENQGEQNNNQAA